MGRSCNCLLSAVVAVGLMAAVPVPAQTFQDELANLHSPNAKTRVKAARALGKSERSEAIAPLIEAMRDPEVKVRRAVLDALRKFHDVSAVDGLLTGLRDEDKKVRSDAMEAVVELYGATEKRLPIVGIFTGARTPEKAQPVTPPEPKVVKAVEARLRDDEPSIRRRAAYALGMLESRESVQALVRALPDMVQDVRNEVVIALGRIGGEAAGQALVRALADSSDETRRHATEALGRMKYRPAARALLTVYEAEKGKSMGDRALAALAQMGAPEARGVFYQNLTNRSPKRRRYAAEGLGRLNDRNLLTGLTKDFLREPDEKVQLAYCYSLARLGRPEFVDRLALSLSRVDLRDQARAYLVELGSPFLTEIVAYLTDPVAEVRKGTVRALMEIGDPAAIPYLEPLLADSDSKVADWANRAIAKLQKAQLTALKEPVK